MVCKENVVSWFRNLSSYKRIDLMCTLLNMCIPFEIRYLGTCIEDIGKRDYNDLRDTEHRANNSIDITELNGQSITDKRTRQKLVLYMALLQSCNYQCAVILYKNLSNVDIQEIVNLLNASNEEQALEELLSLYTMALNHPAFTYQQKSVFSDIFVKLLDEERRLEKTNQKSCGPCTDPELPVNNCLIPPPVQTYHGDMAMRNMAMSIPPPGLCLPGITGAEQMSSQQYLHVGFPSMSHMNPWTGQVVMGNQMIYHTGDNLNYPTSPLVSRQSSPSQSRSPSRSNSPRTSGSRQVLTLPRLRTTGDKGNLPNYSLNEIRRMSDEDLRDIGLTNNVVGQLRSLVKNQTNGINDKKSTDDDTIEVTSEDSTPTTTTTTTHVPINYQNHTIVPNFRRYPTIQPTLDPTQLQMYSGPPPMYTQNTSCYACLTLPVTNSVHTRYQRCGSQHVYCLSQLHSLRLDPDNKSSSSDSTGSRSPPETPPAAPWSNDVSNDQQQQQPPERPRTRKNQHQQQNTQVLRGKTNLVNNNNNNNNNTNNNNNQMVNGGSGLGPCLSYPTPPGAPSQVTYLSHAHFSGLRPSGIYSNFSPAYARPAYPNYHHHNHHQQQGNGEMMYQYQQQQQQQQQQQHHHPAVMAAAAVVSAAQPSAPYISSPSLSYSTLVSTQPPPPSKISCYNCGSNGHAAVDCKDQTVEDLTKKAQYRLDYNTNKKQPGDCSSSDK